MTTVFRNMILVSVFGHFALLSVFSFSFGKTADLGCRGIYFWGSLPSSSPACLPVRLPGLVPIRLHDKSLEIKPVPAGISLRQLYSKPACPPALLREDKISYFCRQTASYPWREKRLTALTFYPELPYYFNVYFKDRQVAHIELDFNIRAAGNAGEVDVKRRISSGNLEADLISMRYIRHYLFIQKTRFTPGVWQKVKIDLTGS